MALNEVQRPARVAGASHMGNVGLHQLPNLYSLMVCGNEARITGISKNIKSEVRT
jgi:hypothetical protein